MDLKRYAVAFKEKDGTDNAVQYFKDGYHISEHYGIPFTEIGFADVEAFRLAGIQALHRRLFWANSQFACEASLLQESAISIIKEQHKVYCDLIDRQIVELESLGLSTPKGLVYK